MTPQAAAPAVETLPRRLTLLDATNVVIGTMIGSAIFLVPGIITQNVPSAPLILAIWVLAGILSLFGALAYAELGAMMPATGGQYVYLREAWGPLWAFLCGWTFFLAARSGATAAVAAGFSIYLAQFVPMSTAVSRIVAATLILLLTWVNYRGVKLGAAVQNTFTALKVLGLALLIGGTLMNGRYEPWSQHSQTSSVTASSFAAAFIACIWAYNGWFAVSLIGGEIKEPQRNLPRALLLGTTFVTCVYVLANIGYLRTLTIAEIASSETCRSRRCRSFAGERRRHICRVDDPGKYLRHNQWQCHDGASALLRAGAGWPFLSAFRRHSSCVQDSTHLDPRSGYVGVRSRAHGLLYSARVLRGLHILDLLRVDRRRFAGDSSQTPGCPPTIPDVRLPCHPAALHRCLCSGRPVGRS